MEVRLYDVITGYTSRMEGVRMLLGGMCLTDFTTFGRTTNIKFQENVFAESEF